MASSVLVLVSGGVDSLTSACLLRETGCRVEALFLKMTGLQEEEKALESVHDLLDRIGVRLHVEDVAENFKRRVIRYFEDSYRAGLTPSCCCVCNWHIKVRRGLEAADRLGIERIATGHYARVVVAKRPLLLSGIDETKDQSYFLHRIPSRVFGRMVFPIGNLTKRKVEVMATDLGILSGVRPESQDICFFRGDYRDFLKKRHPEFSRKGKIITVDGAQIGTHNGVCNYTVGQRRGLGVPDVTPFYVVDIRARENVVVVGKEQDLLKSEMVVEDMNWIIEPSVSTSFVCRVKIRSRHRAASATVHPVGLGLKRVKVLFRHPQKAITPGQFAVFYKGEVVLGGGRICG